MRFLILLLSVSVLGYCKLNCGVDPVTGMLMEMWVKLDCEHKLKPFTDCCENHSKCYWDGNTKGSCDNAYCSCAKKAAKKHPMCKMHSGNFCMQVKFDTKTYADIQQSRKKGVKSSGK